MVSAAGLGILMGGVALMAGCKPKQATSFTMPPRPVGMAKAVAQDVPIIIEAFGTLNPLNNVNVKPQVSGELKDVCFNEGDLVKSNALLCVIDPRPYQAALEKSEAALASDEVNLRLKKDTLERNKGLLEKNFISKQDYEKLDVDVASTEAAILQDKAGITTAKINLEYCYIRAPVDGITGKRKVDRGNVVGPSDLLVNVKTMDPLYVDFTVPERHLASIRQAMAAGVLAVMAVIPGDTNSYAGPVSFLDNGVDNTTGTVALRGVIPNASRALWAGQFVQVRLVLSVKKNAVVVPYLSVQLGQQGAYVFVVTANSTVDLKLVTVGQKTDDEIVVEKGLAAGDIVVTTGQMGLSPGAPVMDLLVLQQQMAAQAAAGAGAPHGAAGAPGTAPDASGGAPATKPEAKVSHPADAKP